MSGPDAILRFWFSDRVKKHWFKSTDAFDAEIRQTFETVAMGVAAERATQNSEHDWEIKSPQAHLALIIALDQFPRNMYRDTPAAFAWDEFALAAAKRMVARRTDFLLPQDHRPFVYMPFMHSEDLSDQDECVRLCEARLDELNTLKYAHIHRDIIMRFGRFPHRNKIIGRETLLEEQEFLDEGGFSG